MSEGKDEFNPNYSVVLPYGEVIILASKLPPSPQRKRLLKAIEELVYIIPKEKTTNE